jgi:hypothetical protein
MLQQDLALFLRIFGATRAGLAFTGPVLRKIIDDVVQDENRRVGARKLAG